MRYILRRKQQSKNTQALSPHKKSSIELNLLFEKCQGNLIFSIIFLSGLSLFPFFIVYITLYSKAKPTPNIKRRKPTNKQNWESQLVCRIPEIKRETKKDKAKINASMPNFLTIYL